MLPRYVAVEALVCCIGGYVDRLYVHWTSSVGGVYRFEDEVLRRVYQKKRVSTTGTPDWPIMQGQRSRSGLDAYPDPLRCAYLALPSTSWGAGHRLFTTLIATGFVEAPRKANQLTAVVLDRPMTLADLAMGKI